MDVYVFVSGQKYSKYKICRILLNIFSKLYNNRQNDKPIYNISSLTKISNDIIGSDDLTSSEMPCSEV